MAAGIAETFFQFAIGKAWVNDVGARPFVKIFRVVGHGFGFFLDMMEKIPGSRKFSGLEKIPDGGRKIKDVEFLFRISRGLLAGGASRGMASGFPSGR